MSWIKLKIDTFGLDAPKWSSVEFKAQYHGPATQGDQSAASGMR